MALIPVVTPTSTLIVSLAPYPSPAIDTTVPTVPIVGELVTIRPIRINPRQSVWLELPTLVATTVCQPET